MSISNEKAKNDKIIPDNLKTKRMCKYAAKKLPSLLTYVSNH